MAYLLTSHVDEAMLFISVVVVKFILLNYNI
jgi:hypothetical protein